MVQKLNLQNITEIAINYEPMLGIINFFLDWKKRQNKTVIGGKIVYDVKGYYKYIYENELFKYWMSHVFLNCANELIEEIADKNKHLSDEEIKNRDIEIELKIDGNECDPRKFFSMLWEQYEYQIRKEATKIVKEQTSEKFQEIQSKLQDYEQICENWANDINWQVSNKFTHS